jgi:hypothetical protein
MDINVRIKNLTLVRCYQRDSECISTSPMSILPDRIQPRQPGKVAYSCNPSFLQGRDQED